MVVSILNIVDRAYFFEIWFEKLSKMREQAQLGNYLRACYWGGNKKYYDPENIVWKVKETTWLELT